MDRLRSFLDSIQTSFLSGDLEVMLASFTFPMVVYSVAGVTVLRDKAAFLHTAEQYHAAMMQKAVVTSRIDIVECEEPWNCRLRVVARIEDMDSGGNTVTTSLIRYFLKQTEGGYRVEMLEYLEAPLPLEDVERIVH